MEGIFGSLAFWWLYSGNKSTPKVYNENARINLNLLAVALHASVVFIVSLKRILNCAYGLIFGLEHVFACGM